jgi:hypothetical protein
MDIKNARQSQLGGRDDFLPVVAALDLPGDVELGLFLSRSSADLAG